MAFTFKAKYGNFIGGKFVEPVDGQYFDNITPVNGSVLCQVARSNAKDIELALDAAHAAKDAWGATSVAERSVLLNRIAQAMDDNLAILAEAETWDNGKPIRETTAADVPLGIDHFRYFAGVIRAQEGSLSELDADTVAYHFHEPLGVVGQIIPWNFPLLMAIWKLAPALAAGNCVVLKPAEQTPASIMVLMELIADILPAGVVNVVNGFGLEAGKPLASSTRIAKIAFTGETTTGRLIMQYASQNIIPCTLELGGKSPNIFFKDVADHDDDFFDKAIEGFVLFAFNQGEVCTCPSRALIHENPSTIEFMERAHQAGRSDQVQGSPLESLDTMIGAQASSEQLEKDPLLSSISASKEGAEGADRRRAQCRSSGDLAEGGYYVKPTVFARATTRCAIFQEEIFGPVVSVCHLQGPKRKRWRLPMTRSMALAPACGPAMATRCLPLRSRRSRPVSVWTNCYHAYPAHAAFGGYKQSGIGRENHLMMLHHYQQTKNLLVSYSPKKLGFF